MDTCTILWLDNGASEVWHGNRTHIYQYALEEGRPFHLRDAEEEELQQALPFFWGYRRPCDRPSDQTSEHAISEFRLQA